MWVSDMDEILFTKFGCKAPAFRPGDIPSSEADLGIPFGHKPVGPLGPKVFKGCVLDTGSTAVASAPVPENPSHARRAGTCRCRRRPRPWSGKPVATADSAVNDPHLSFTLQVGACEEAFTTQALY